MKIKLFSLLIAIISPSAFSQQGQIKVDFINDSDHLFVIGTPVAGDPTGPIPASPLPSGNSLIAQLYVGTNADSMTLQSSVLLDAGGWGPTNGLMLHAHVVVNGVPAGQVSFFNIVISDVVGATNSPFVQGPASGAVYYGTSGTFTATIPSSISYVALRYPANPTSTWTPADLVINAVANSPTVTLVGFPQAGGELQIVTSATLTVRAYDFVVESSTNFLAWTVMGTNALSYNSSTGDLMGTNVVEMTNSMTFYRVEAVGR